MQPVTAAKVKYGIPRTQSLAARETTVQRKQKRVDENEVAFDGREVLHSRMLMSDAI